MSFFEKWPVHCYVSIIKANKSVVSGQYMTIKVLLLILIMLSNSIYALDIYENKSKPAVIVNVVSSEWRPYASAENGVVKGFAYEIVKAVFERADVPFEFAIKPWARVYMEGRDKKNYMIAGVGRTREREVFFSWIGPVTKGSDIFFYKLRGNPLTINNLDDAKNHQVAVVRDTYYYNFLAMKGFDKNNIHIVNRVEQLLELIVMERDDFFLFDDTGVLKYAKELNISPTLFKKALFAFNVTDYMAFSKTSSPEIVERVRSSYESLKKEGRIILH